MDSRQVPPYDEIDAGVRDVVQLVYEAGFEPCDSGDGSKVGTMGCALPFKHVFCVVDPADMLAEAGRLQVLLDDSPLQRWWKVEASYSAKDGRAFLLAIED